jgi:hypothetical protein
MEWLLMHSEDADADAPLTAEQKRQLVAIYGPRTCPQSALMLLSSPSVHHGRSPSLPAAAAQCKSLIPKCSRQSRQTCARSPSQAGTSRRRYPALPCLPPGSLLCVCPPLTSLARRGSLCRPGINVTRATSLATRAVARPVPGSATRYGTSLSPGLSSSARALNA